MQVPERLALIGGSILLSSILIFTLRSQASQILPKVGNGVNVTFQSDKSKPSDHDDSKKDSTARTIHVHFVNRWDIGNQDLGSKDISVKQGDTVNLNSIAPSGYAGFFGTIPHFNKELANYSYDRITRNSDKDGNFDYYLGSTTPDEVPLGIKYYYNGSEIKSGTAHFDLNEIYPSDQLDVTKQVPMPRGYHINKSSNFGETPSYPYIKGEEIVTSSEVSDKTSLLGVEFDIVRDK